MKPGDNEYYRMTVEKALHLARGLKYGLLPKSDDPIP